MTLEETTDRWVLSPEDPMTVSRCSVDFTFTLLLLAESGVTYEVTISTPFTLKSADGEIVLDPEGDRRLLAPALAAFGAAVTAVAWKDGALDLLFGDAASIHVPASADYEAWELSGPGGPMAVSLPGGELATWS